MIDSSSVNIIRIHFLGHVGSSAINNLCDNVTDATACECVWVCINAVSIQVFYY